MTHSMAELSPPNKYIAGFLVISLMGQNPRSIGLSTMFAWWYSRPPFLDSLPLPLLLRRTFCLLCRTEIFGLQLASSRSYYSLVGICLTTYGRYLILLVTAKEGLATLQVDFRINSVWRRRLSPLCVSRRHLPTN